MCEFFLAMNDRIKLFLLTLSDCHRILVLSLSIKDMWRSIFSFLCSNISPFLQCCPQPRTGHCSTTLGQSKQCEGIKYLKIKQTYCYLPRFQIVCNFNPKTPGRARWGRGGGEGYLSRTGPDPYVDQEMSFSAPVFSPGPSCLNAG